MGVKKRESCVQFWFNQAAFMRRASEGPVVGICKRREIGVI
jgi:hypothetical protein